ncbi:biotin carboxyl carrier protein [Pacificibacter maritimus]|uniref:Biotin carboxyl carrier protein n=1 Tax=Pacificibacter maritimus TaxID=762213 RepID=A0A3N4UDP5_9RHOB|nr:hypothetical protein [Pacificibacter maritimus]RPE66555.1 biotin carboxyl carrier protein [Pacificibacter maritimus]
MFVQADLDRLIDAMRANGVSSLEVKSADQSLQLDLEHQAHPSALSQAPAPVQVQTKSAKSPCIGRFLPRGVDDGLAEIGTDTEVQAGDTLGYIEYGVARAVVGAPVAGRVMQAAPESGTVFGFGDVVFNLEVSK